MSAPKGPRDPAASMALLFDTIRNPIDPLYRDRAEHRQRDGVAPAKLSTPLSVVVLLLIGLLMGVGASSLRQRNASVHDKRQEIVSQISQQQKHNDTAVSDIRSLRRDIATMQEAALGRASKGTLADKLSAAERDAAATSLKGPGIMMTIANPSDTSTTGNDSDPRTGSAAGQLTSTDVQQLVNAYKSAGATGIAINDQRLSSISAIRFAGSAILVNYRPLAPPYRIAVVGPSSMQATFNKGFGGQYVQGLKTSGFTVAIQNADVTLPASPSTKLSYAHVVQESTKESD